MLEDHIRNRRRRSEILLMTHIVLGYPSMEQSLRLVDAMVDAGVDLMELQIPFSEPTADGPVILRANQQALAAGTTVAGCLEAAAELARRHPIPFLVMTYYNIVFTYGVRRFCRALAEAGIKGAIVADLPYEEAGDYLDAMTESGLDPIFIFAPTTSDSRMRAIAQVASGFVYCVARKGVTGQHTDFSTELEAYLARCRAATDLPLAVGFGVGSARDVDFLRGRADIAVVGTRTLQVLEDQGLEAVGPFIAGLRRH